MFATSFIAFGLFALLALAIGFWIYRRGRATQRLDDSAHTIRQQKEMLDAVNHRPNSMRDLVERMRHGNF